MPGMIYTHKHKKVLSTDKYPSNTAAEMGGIHKHGN